jgi:hypothetical protein
MAENLFNFLKKMVQVPKPNVIHSISNTKLRFRSSKKYLFSLMFNNFHIGHTPILDDSREYLFC